MQRRNLLLVAGLALGLAACDKQPAGPTVEANNTGAIRAVVVRDTALGDATTGDTSKFAPAAGVRVNIFVLGDTLPIRQATLLSDGTVLFVGLAPGEYVVSPATSGTSVALGRGADTVTVVADDTTTISTQTIRVRLGSTISGRLNTTTIDQTAMTTTPFGGVTVTIQRETGLNTNTYATYATTTTDATGFFSVPVLPGRQRYRVVFDETTIATLTADTDLLLNGSGTTTAVRGTRTSSAFALAPGASSTQNFAYRYNTRITGAVYRDNNGNGVKDAGEGLLNGDQVVIQLRNAAGDRAITQVTVSCTTAAGCSSSTYTFSGLAAGSYTVTVDMVGSRFADTFPRVVQQPDPLTATVATNLSGSVTLDIPLQLL